MINSVNVYMNKYCVVCHHGTVAILTGHRHTCDRQKKSEKVKLMWCGKCGDLKPADHKHQ